MKPAKKDGCLKKSGLAVAGLLVSLGLFFLLCLRPLPVLAESGWFTCTVDLAGPGSTETFIALTDLAAEPAFVGKWFLLPQERAKMMLAVALAAINGGRQVVVVVDPDANLYPQITDIYLKAR
ncbi:MAG: hypothetical protein JXR89_08375 [Deltaproteobacteria bacterium]|nr:hypothetical protein [Deltaproteobacteria bacterium]